MAVKRAPGLPAGSPIPPPVSRRVRIEQELIEQVFLLQTLMDTIPDSIYFKDKNSRFTRVNRYTAGKFGITDPGQVQGKTDFDFFTDEHAQQAFRDEQEILRTGQPLVAVEEKETLPGGGVKWVSTTKMPLRDSEGRIVGTFGISRDITERKAIEARLEQQALYDSLTQLPNRALFMNRVEHLLQAAKRRPMATTLFAIIYLDLDRFKGVNDSLGHQEGDELLVQLARRLETCVRPTDTLARIGGDEFSILLDDIKSEADATRVAARIQQELTAPFTVNGTEIFSSMSLGIALSSSGYDRPEDMVRDADIAMYRAKANGRSRYEIFDSEMHKRAASQLALETDLRRALDRKEHLLHYQPIVDLETRRVEGFEALVRWKHPRRGMVGPDVFIPIAEETGLICPLGLWVLEEACRQVHVWQARFPDLAPLTMSVNLSTRQLSQPDFVDQVQRVLAETQVDPSTLSLEITESALMQNVKVGTEAIQRLRELSIRLHLDDFGTGYSSLSYLHAFPVDTLKIDRSFVDRMKLGAGQIEIVRAIIALAQNLGMGVTAEGVETVEQVALLRTLNCKKAQGYFFSRPLPADEAEKLLINGLRAF